MSNEKANRARFRQKKIGLVEARKSIGCQICRYKGHPSSLDLHHVDPKMKKFQMAKLSRRASLSAIIEELDKCIVLCSNCHRNLHAGEIKLRTSAKSGSVWVEVN